MRFSIATWNINSVRLRIDLVAKFIKTARPDVLCLQETKCPDDQFPLKRFKRLGYSYAALNGQKGYHGVAVLSQRPFSAVSLENFCGKSDCRHLKVAFGADAGLATPITVHNFYVPAGGDVPDPAANAKFAHKLDFLDEMRAHGGLHPRDGERAILVGDLNVAPLEHDVWSHRQMVNVVSHTPVECEKLSAVRAAGDWIDVARHFVPEPRKLYTWWSYRAADWAASDRGRRLDHIWASPSLRNALVDVRIARTARGWERPSDHVPVTAVLTL